MVIQLADNAGGAKVGVRSHCRRCYQLETLASVGGVQSQSHALHHSYTILDSFGSGEAKAVMVEYGPQVLREVDMFQDEGFRSFW